MGIANDGLEPIAIIGMACVFPQASNIQEFWKNIVTGVDAVTEPTLKWDADRYLKSGRIKTACGGYLKDLYHFDPREFGIMPNSLDGGEPDQFMALRVARDALLDAGYLTGDYDHYDTGIILGHSTYLHRGQGTLIQNHIVLDQTIELLQVACPFISEEKLTAIRVLLESKLPQSNSDIAPGLVPNVMTGRIANRLNFKGPNYLIDAACSSSLLAVNAAIDELRAGRSRMMLAGGVNASLPAEVAVIFTQLGALSERRKVRPFEEGSDGTLLGEGLGVVVLKRLSDAISAGDRVYAVVRGIGQASDGRGHGLLAPSIEGETLAIQRAYSKSGIDPASISLIEAHGTGIPLGDKTEIAALENVFGKRKENYGSVALGSVKSMISHCIPAAGIAGLIKSALALHHKILPPTLCDNVNPELGIASTPFYINTQKSPWISQLNIPRRVGINSFGFGGINTHAILEEAPESALKPERFTPWEAEICIFSADNREELANNLKQTSDFIGFYPERRIADIAAALAAKDKKGQYRLAIIAKDNEDLPIKIEDSLRRLRKSDSVRWSTKSGIVYSETRSSGKLAFLFPGEGSQYIGMLSDLAIYFDEVRQWFDFWRSLYDAPPGSTRTDVIFPPISELTEQRRSELEKRLNDMDVGSEAAFIGGQAMYALLRSLGVEPDVMVGHSSGESSALAASGAILADNPQQLAEFIRQLNKVYQQILKDGKIPVGKLLTVGALPLTVVEKHIDALNENIVIAMDNCTNQLILYGDAGPIESIHKSLSAEGGICFPLPFDRGYHTAAFSEASKAFLKFYKKIKLVCPRVPLYSCSSADLFPDTTQSVQQLAAAQWSTKVRFRETLLKMYHDGVRYFIEVGPSGNLSAFVKDTLTKKPHVSLATNLRHRNNLDHFLTTLAFLYVDGRPVKIENLFNSRFITSIDFSNSIQIKHSSVLLDNTMPKIRLSDADRISLQKLTINLDRETDVISLSSNDVEIKCEDSRSKGSIVQESVMSDYFDVMRNFLGQQSSVVKNWQLQTELIPEEEQPSSSVIEYTSLLDSIEELDHQHLKARCYFNIKDDRFIIDHVLSGIVSKSEPDLRGLSCIPFMVSLEIMAEACAVLANSIEVFVIENVKAMNWITLDDGEITFEVHAELTDIESRIFCAKIITSQGVAVSADFRFKPDWHCKKLSALKEKRVSRWNGSELYSTGMFHGPIFQSIAHIEGWDEEGIDANLSDVSLDGFLTARETPKLIINPVLLDAMGQLSAYWIAQQIGTDFNSFPSTIQRIELYTQCPANITGLKLQARQYLLDDTNKEISSARAWQFECIDQNGYPVVRLANLINIFFPVPNRFYQVRRDPLNGWLGHLFPVLKDDILVWELPNLSEEFCAQSGGIFLRILSHIFLSVEERDAWKNLQANKRYQSQWLLGRACIKEAVRYWIFQKTGQLLYPSDIYVLHDQYGAPYVDGLWCNTLIQPPEVSLSHNNCASLAAISESRSPVGIDIEEINKIRNNDLMIETLTASEEAFVRGLDSSVLNDKLLRFWCAKEAASKFLGLGLQGKPTAFEVSFMDTRCESACVTYSEFKIDVVVTRKDNSIIALASC